MSVDVDHGALDRALAGDGAVLLDGAGSAHALLSVLAHRVDHTGRRAVRVTGSAALQRLPFGALGGLVRLSDGDTPALMAQVCTQITALDVPLVLIDDAHLLDPLSAVALHQLVARGAVQVVASAPGPVQDGPVRAFIGALARVSAAATVEPPTTCGPRDPAQRRLIQALALAGDLALDDAERRFGPDATATLETAGLVRVHEESHGTRLVPTDPRAAAALLAELDPAAREVLCADLVRALRDSTDTDPRRTIQVALLMEQGAAADRDPRLLADAAQAARTIGNPALARELAAGAVAAGAGTDALLTLAEVMTWTGAATDAERLLADLDPTVPAGPARTRLVGARAANLHCNLGAGEEAERLLAAARDDDAPGGVLDALALQFALFRGDLAQVLRDGVPLAESAAPDSPATVWLTTATAPALAAVGRWNEAERHVRAGFRASERTASGTQRFTLGLAATDAALARGRIDDARDICERLYERAAGEPEATAIVDALAGRVGFAAGDVDAAAQALHRAADSARHGGTPVWSAVVSAWHATAAMAVGDGERARTACAYAQATMPPYVRFYEPDLRIAQAATVDDPWTAARYLSVGAESARSQGNLWGELRLRLALARIDGTHQEAPAALLAERFPTPVAQALRDCTAAQAAGDGRARRAATEALTRLGAGPSAPDGDAAPSYRGLSEREREVVALVIRGLSNREAADLLGVSTRTVEGHLYRAYAKLGVIGRRELVERFA